jgi:FkbM family methyltransferase
MPQEIGEPPVARIRNAFRRQVAAMIARTPSIRGRGRLVLFLDRLLTDSRNPTSYNVLASVNGSIRLFLDLRSWEQKFAYYYRHWDQEQLDLVSRSFPGGDFCDIGASIGLYTVTFASICHTRGDRLFAVEPVPANLQRLRQQIELNGLEDTVTVLPIGLDCEPGKVQMALTAEGIPGNAKISVGGSCTVPVRTLDDVWSEQGRRHIGFVKIDTEGWDARIILGGRDAIATCRPNMLVEFNRERMTNNRIPLEPCWRFLTKELGYRCLRLDRRKGLVVVDDGCNRRCALPHTAQLAYSEA